VRRLFLAVSTGLLAILLLAPPAAADEVQGSDPSGDVPFALGDLISFRAIHGPAGVDLRVRTLMGGNPENVWPNRATRIRWRLDTNFAHPGPEFFADIQIATGVDTVMLGRVRRVSNGHLLCSAQNHVPGASLVTASGNQYRFRFPRSCIGAPLSFRARATFIWDNNPPNVGPVFTDFAPNGGPTAPIETPV
jgi:hypothetical protein